MGLKVVSGIIALFLASVSFNLMPAICSPTTRVCLDPQIAYVLPGESYIVDVKIADVENLYSWQVRLEFNPDVLSYVNVTEGDFLAEQPEGTYGPTPKIEETWVFFGWSTIGRYDGVTGTGTLATVEFEVEAVGESLLDIDHAYTKLFEVSFPPVPPGQEPVREIPHTRENAVFINSIEPPKADFIFSPSIPALNQLVTFDASASYASSPNVVGKLLWDFGDGTTEIYVRDVNLTYTTNHTYIMAGTYTVTLTVIDNASATELIEAIFGSTTMPDIWYKLYSTKTAFIEIKIGHDIALTGVMPSATEVAAGETVSISVTALNKGTEIETFDVTAYYGDKEIETKQVTDLVPEEEETVVFNWDTTGVEAGTYLVWAEAVVEGEGFPGDNEFVDGTIAVSPPQVRILTVKLSGAHDYSDKERVRLKLTALVRDRFTLEPVSNTPVIIEIYGPDGSLWVSDVMVERLVGTGIYEWATTATVFDLIKRDKLEKGVYLVHVHASSEGGLTASDILQFHIDPPGEEPVQLHLILLPVLVAALIISISVGGLDHRRLSRRLSEPTRKVC